MLLICGRENRSESVLAEMCRQDDSVTVPETESLRGWQPEADGHLETVIV
jgi:hypothetical protein